MQCMELKLGLQYVDPTLKQTRDDYESIKTFTYKLIQENSKAGFLLKNWKL